MELLQKIICVIGVFCFSVGGCSLDSANMLLPAALCIVGGILVLLTYHAYKL